MRVVLTGASSFTGFWFARMLAASGIEIIAPLSGLRADYSGIRAERLALLTDVCQLHFSLQFGTTAFLDFIKLQDGIDVFCHHWSQVRNYRSPDYDFVAALKENTLGLPDLIELLQQLNCKGIVLTGSIGEQREGQGSAMSRAFSPYGLSKGLTWDVFDHLCRTARMPLDKFVIPNPFGAYEDARFTNYLMRTWTSGETAQVATPDYIRDNIHVDVLALLYANFVLGRIAGHVEERRRLAPSLYRESQGAFAMRFAAQARRRTGMACELALNPQKDFSEPLERVNADDVRSLAPNWNETAAWDQAIDFYRGRL